MYVEILDAAENAAEAGDTMRLKAMVATLALWADECTLRRTLEVARRPRESGVSA
jgi:hypothetical protein